MGEPKVIRELLWRGVARIVTVPAVTDWLIERAKRTPYTHITKRDGEDLYMERFWLFNPYPPLNEGAGRRWGDWLPSVRIHHIVRPDDDAHLHSHPWHARTVILSGFYMEELPADGAGPRYRLRGEGDTGRLRHEDFHRIDNISKGGVWTLFITWKKQGTWYFDVDGIKVPWRQYLGLEGGE
jgi:hypothetical protein